MRAAAVLGVGLVAAAPLTTAGCGDNFSALVDSFPIIIARAPMGGGMPGDGALIAMASAPDEPDPGKPFLMLVGTGTPLTQRSGPPVTGTPQTERVRFDLLDAPGALTDPATAAVRARFQGVSVLRLPLRTVGDLSTTLGGILGGDVLRRFSIDMRFGFSCSIGTGICSSMTFWNHLGPDLGFLQDSNYAVLRFSLAGGGEVTAEGDPDFLGERGPLVLAPSRIVLRTCAAPDDFVPETAPIDVCCKEQDAERLATGVDLALVLDTGVGPIVLSASAWTRIKNKLAAPPVETPNPDPTCATPTACLMVPTWPDPIPTIVWSTLPKVALVDLETGGATDPGPCVELGRSRRLEQVSYQVVQDETNMVPTTACTQPCDNDPREPDKAQNSAAYLELTAPIPVAVIADDHPYLQGLRFDVRPEGPEVDGVLGAGALGRSRVELDYLSAPSRAVFSCEPEVPRTECFAAARCPRLPDDTYTHLCFGLKRHGFAPACMSGC